ncbi:DoxX family protein [Rhizobium sp. Leaf262]|uniref:DoxX family protein n=1 Tax=Rhizobium sp. Leaf262 TaxID=1736312 RepID=UPI000715E20F|nr:DoxX family protein [Rhizobium sp. Leaf262]KQO75648.1 DoxX family protein [Rhizobium sp. Leaf262]
MNKNAPFSNDRTALIIPLLSGFYERFAQPLAWTALRVAIGGMLVVEGYPKIMAPFAQVGFVENLGFYPGWLWSPTLAAMQFFGGMFLAVGLFTRPVALANTVMLAITLWFHFANPYGHALLTEAGMEALKAADQTLFTPQGLRRLADGGTIFLEQVQTKAELASLFWTGGAALFAAFGGGYWSMDRSLLKKQF